MEFIIDFYKSLDTLNLIIFWGIIIVIILLLILSFILINKNKKLKYLVDSNNKIKEELPIKKEEIEQVKSEEKLTQEKPQNIILPSIPETPKVIISEDENIENEKKFIAEEHVMEYNNELFSLSNIKKTSEINNSPSNNEANCKPQIEIPTKPYQKNVLREMSLYQTSPIGITSPIKKEDRKVEMAKDLAQSLINDQKENIEENKIMQEPNKKERKELTITDTSKLIKNETKIDTYNNNIERKNISNVKPKIDEEIKIERNVPINNVERSKEIFNDISKSIESPESKSSSEQYLEEVSRKLSEAEVPDEIARTNYELEQEENAIISYKELMEKKDSIQTIDEEDAVISIEELMNRSNQKQEQVKEEKENVKLYNLTEEEENDNFIKELKQFRNDL